MSLVSIIIPVYKSEHLLQFSLNSAVNQTYKNKEIIVINDGSYNEKRIKKILVSFKNYPIDYISIKKNKGVSYALNMGLKKSRGKYVCWLSHDDIFSKNKLSEQIKCLKNKNVIVSSNFIEINSLNSLQKKKVLPQNYYDRTTLSLMINDRLNGCTLLIPKILIKKIGYFDEKLLHTQDYDMWIRLSRKFKFVHCEKFLLKMRIHKRQSSKIGKFQAQIEKKALFEKYYNYIKSDVEKLSIFNFFYYEAILLRKEMTNASDQILNTYIKNKPKIISIFFIICFFLLKQIFKFIK